MDYMESPVISNLPTGGTLRALRKLRNPISRERGSSESYGCRHLHDCSWQCEVKRRAMPVIAVGPDPSAMRFDDRLADCQAHAAALWFRVKNASNIWSALAKGSPGPVSFTEISIWPSSPNCDFAVTTPFVCFIASMPFIIKFMSTC